MSLKSTNKAGGGGSKSVGRFTTKKAAKKNAKQLLTKYESSPGTPITDEQDVRDIEAMIDNHPNGAGIVGPGVLYHCVKRNGWGTKSDRGFHTIRCDGTDDSWSYQTAIAGKYKSPKARAEAALRQEVQPQIDDARRKFMSENHLAPNDFREAHHGIPWPFRRLWTQFLKSEFLELEEIEVEKVYIDGVELPARLQIVDRELAERWRQFHAERANIKFLAKSTHGRISVKSAAALRDLDPDEADDFEGCTEEPTEPAE